MSDHVKAAKLKDEGNALFANKKYSEAFFKYSEALEMGGPNPIIFANRAACRLNLKDYLNAADDAKQAIILDPKYAKAHARLATAHDLLKSHHLSSAEWAAALECLPKDNLSPAELKQKEQYRASLEIAKRLKKATINESQVILMKEEDKTKTPWFEALALIPKLRSEQNFNSSAWVIAGAYNEFQRGLESMKSTRRVGEALIGPTGSIEAISNAILQDGRVFHISDPNFFQLYNQQVILESTQFRAWADSGVPTVMKESQERLFRSGWDDVRPALSVTVRGWLVRGFIDSGIRQNYVGFSEFVGRAVDIIDWGRKIWEGVTRTDRGTIFDSTFLRGVLSLELDALMKKFKQPSPSAIADLEKIKTKADRLIQLVEEDPTPALETAEDPGFVLAFWNYPKSQASAMLGFYHKIKGNMSTENAVKEECYQEAALRYIAAAACLPEDDENHCYFLSCALSNAQLSGPTPIYIFLNLLERIQMTKPKMLQIWSKSSLSIQGRDKLIEDSLGGKFNMEQQLLNMLAQGKSKDTLVLLGSAEKK